MKAKFNFLMLVFLMIAIPAFAQNAKKINVTGKVMDEQGFPIIGAGVMVEGTTTGVATDINGTYTINVASDATLSFQSIGYETVSVPVRGRARIDVTLATDSQLLEETVVVGYGTQKKANLTGAVEMVGEDTFAGGTPLLRFARVVWHTA